jgi:hypothetical protein
MSVCVCSRQPRDPQVAVLHSVQTELCGVHQRGQAYSIAVRGSQRLRRSRRPVFARRWQCCRPCSATRTPAMKSRRMAPFSGSNQTAQPPRLWQSVRSRPPRRGARLDRDAAQLFGAVRDGIDPGHDGAFRAARLAHRTGRSPSLRRTHLLIRCRLYLDRARPGLGVPARAPIAVALRVRMTP